MACLTKPAACAGCSLETKGEGFAPAEGPEAAPLLFVGEALGKVEALTGKNFVGDAGGMLTRLFNLLGWQRDWVRVHNCVSCRPPNDWLDERAPWYYSAINHCRYLDTTLAEPHKVIVTLGATALKRVLGLVGHKKIQVKDFHGTLNVLPSGQIVVPTFHPSFLQRGAHNLIGTVLWDLQQAEAALTAGKPADPAQIICDPPLEWFRAWVDQVVAARTQDREAYPISSDVETPDKAGGKDEGEMTADDRSFQILRVNVSCHPDEGITVPFTGAYINELVRLHQSPGVIWNWNREYDFQRMVGVKVLREEDSPKVVDLMWCLAGHTQVQLWHGGQRRLNDIVDNHTPAVIVGMNEHGERIPVHVVGWHKRYDPRQQWLKVTTWASRYSVICTPDHKIWTKRGWVCADKLTPDDQIPTHKVGSDDLIHGTILGDGYVDDHGTLQMCHGGGQRAWVEAKAHHLGVKPFDRSRGWIAGMAPVGKDWRKLFYRADRSKRFIAPPSDAALAVWYCDDGNYHRNKGVGGLGRARLACDGFSATERKTIVGWFKKRFRSHYVKLQKSNGIYAGLYISRDTAQAFFAAIAPYVPPSMAYKLPEAYRGKYNGWLELVTPRWGRIRSVTTTKHRGPRYCITVDHPTHRFFVRGGLVRNCWHLLQSDLPRGLGFVAPFYSGYGPWKHLSVGDPVRYAAIDALQTHRIGFGLTADLHKLGMYDVAMRHTHVLHTAVLRPAQLLGVKIDRQRLMIFKESLITKARHAIDEIQEVIPQELQPLTPKAGLTKKPLATILHAKASAFTRAGKPRAGKPVAEIKQELYARAELVEKLLLKEVLVCRSCAAVGVQRRHRCKPEALAQVAARTTVDRGALPQIELDVATVTRWFWKEPFNPDSPKQVLDYILWKKHQPGKHKKTKLNTTDRETLERLERQTKDGFYRSLLDYRAVNKVKGTYVEGTERRLDDQDRLHPQPTFKPSTMRLSYVNPNITNVVADKGGKAGLAAGFRQCVVAGGERPAWLTQVTLGEWERKWKVDVRNAKLFECKLLEVDFSAIEAVLTGYFAGDPESMRLAKLGIHAALASHVLGRPYDSAWPDDQIAAYFKEIKKNHQAVYDPAKRFIHGRNYGLTRHGMMRQFPHLFPTEAVAKRYEVVFEKMAPKIPAWQKTTQMLAARQHFLGGDSHPFKYKHWFWSVYTYRRLNTTQYYKILAKCRQDGTEPPVLEMNGQYFRMAEGEDSKRALAMYPQGTASGVLKEALLRLLADPSHPSYIGDAYFGRTPFRAPIHDSGLFEIPLVLWDRIVPIITKEFQRPVPELSLDPAWGLGDHLSIGVAAKAGFDWQEMEDLKVEGFEGDASLAEPMEDEDSDDFLDLARHVS